MAGTNLADMAEKIVRTDPRFAVEEAEIRGVRLRVFKNAPGNLRVMMQMAAAAHGSDDFLVYEDERETYLTFCARVNRLAHALVTEGVSRGDRVALAMRNYPEMLVAMMATAAIGAVVVFVNAWWTTEELDYALGDSGAKLVFADGPRHERIRAFVQRRGIRLVGVRDASDVADETFDQLVDRAVDDSWPEITVDPDDDFAVMYSSGSTGTPKGVVLTHRGAISAVWTWLMGGEITRLTRDPSLGVPGTGPGQRPVIMIVTPLFHITATHALWLQSIPLGAKVVLLHKWDAEHAVDTVNREGVTRILGVPTQTAELMLAAARLGVSMPTLEFIGSGGAKRPPAQVGELADAFPGKIVATGWGMTETNAVGISLSGPDYLARPNAAGRLQPPLQEMKICDDEGREVAPGTVGELVVKSAANMRCYLNQPDATAEVLRDGWLFTGDLAMVDADGIVTIVDRKKNIIIRGGENIACLDVEAAIHRHPTVLEAGVFQVPDHRLGETVGAAIRLRERDSLSPQELRDFLSEHIAAFKIPEHIWFVDGPLPRGATDKIDRRRLRAECLTTLPAADSRTFRESA